MHSEGKSGVPRRLAAAPGKAGWEPDVSTDRQPGPTRQKAAYPWSGQQSCFDAFGQDLPCAGSGQDGDYQPGRAWPEPRFTLPGADLVLDRLTGLVWPRDAGCVVWPRSWEAACTWVDVRNRDGFLGYTDWRLPRRRELLSLTSLAHARPALPPGAPFTGLFQHWHWTSTLSAVNPGDYWRIHLEGGRMFPGHGQAEHMVLPVRGTSWLLPESPQHAALVRHPWPQPRFEALGQGVLDRLTGCVWFAGMFPQEGEVTWQEALDAAKRMPDWRLPTIWELESLVDTSRARPALSPGHPFGEELGGVWSSTSSGYDPAWAWVLYYDKGAVGVGYKPGKHFKCILIQKDLSSGRRKPRT